MERTADAGEDVGGGAAGEEGAGVQQEGGVPVGWRGGVGSDDGEEGGGVPMGMGRRRGGAGQDRWGDDDRLWSSHNPNRIPRQSESWATHESDKEKEDEEGVQAKDEECDPYFNYLVDSFIAAAEKTGPPKQNTDCTAAAQRQSNNYAKTALEHYNKDENNKTQYRLIKALKSCAIQTNESYGHVNFVASSSDSKEEFFFAEVCYDPESNGLVPTCMVSLEENNRIGGLLGIGFVGCPDLLNPPIDDNHCYACDDSVKHPIDGTLFNAGHVAATGFYTSF